MARFWRNHVIGKLAFFGLAMRDAFRADSNVDVLLEFEAEEIPSSISFVGMKLSQIIHEQKKKLRRNREMG
jgi:predicted nucleotidyltransferase